MQRRRVGRRMVGNDSWIYQGRQYHMWFGNGTKPIDTSPQSAAKDVLPSLQDRIHNIGHTFVAGLPASKRHHAAARLGAADHGRLDRLLAGVAHARPLGPRLIPIRVLGTNADAPGVGAFVKAGGVLKAAATHADLREATDLVARGAQEMGLDRFKPFLRRADDHLTQTGGMLALLRDVPTPTAPTLAPPPSAMPAGPRLPPGQLGPLLRTVLRGAGVLGAAAELLDAYTRREQEQQLRDVIERFKLDPTNPADAAAALAFRWAQNKGPWLFDTPQTGPEMQAMAERVMRAVQADPMLLGRALDGDRASMAALTAMAQGKTVPGSGIETRTDEERALVAQMMSQGTNGAEIQAALDHLRATGRAPTAEERRNTPGVAVMSAPLPRIVGSWLVGNGGNEAGAPVPAQVAEKLAGRSFPNFKAFREAFWRAVAATPELAEQFNERNQQRMRDGTSPFAPDSETGGRSGVWELHHSPEIGKNGLVYDLSTIRIVTPDQHDGIHYRRK